MEFSDEMLSTIDIDWFFQIGDYPIHVASAGGKIPRIVKSSIEDSNAMVKEVRQKKHDLYKPKELKYNQELKNILNFSEQNVSEYKRVLIALRKDEDYVREEIPDIFLKRYYIPPFSYYAVKGFISLDRNIDGDNEDEYHWVAKPLDPHALDYISQRYIIPDKRITPETIEVLLNGIENNNINIVDFVDKLTE